MAARAAPSGAELYAKVQHIVNTEDTATLTKRGARQLLAGDFGAAFVKDNKSAINRMVMEAVQRRHGTPAAAPPPPKQQKAGAKGAAGTARHFIRCLVSTGPERHLPALFPSATRPSGRASPT